MATKNPDTFSLPPVRPPTEIIFPDKCSRYSMMEPSLNLNIPEECCNFENKECLSKYNGKCRLRWDTADCDYTVDVCQTKNASYTANWFCTCCASCQGDDRRNDCTDNKGVCRRCCHDDEFSVFWHKCSNDNCMCCKKHCPSDTCASGTGKCVHKSQDCPEDYLISDRYKCEGTDCKCCQKIECNGPCALGDGICMPNFQHCPPGYDPSHEDFCFSTDCQCCKKNDCQGPCSLGNGICVAALQDCPQGYYISTDEVCKYPGCKCCKPCKTDETCSKKQGFCEGRNRKCPLHYTEHDYCCPDEECRCCNPGLISDPVFPVPRKGVVVKQKQEMEIELPQNP